MTNVVVFHHTDPDKDVSSYFGRQPMHSVPRVGEFLIHDQSGRTWDVKKVGHEFVNLTFFVTHVWVQESD